MIIPFCKSLNLSTTGLKNVYVNCFIPFLGPENNSVFYWGFILIYTNQEKHQETSQILFYDVFQVVKNGQLL